MSVSSEFLDNVKLFLRVDGTDNDDIIQDFTNYAIAYVERTTGRSFLETDNLHRMVVKLLVRHYYDNNDSDIPFGIMSILTQIKYSPTFG